MGAAVDALAECENCEIVGPRPVTSDLSVPVSEKPLDSVLYGAWTIRFAIASRTFASTRWSVATCAFGTRVLWTSLVSRLFGSSNHLPPMKACAAAACDAEMLVPGIEASAEASIFR